MNLNQPTTSVFHSEEARQEAFAVDSTPEPSIAVLDDVFLAYVGGGTGVGNMQ